MTAVDRMMTATLLPDNKQFSSVLDISPIKKGKGRKGKKDTKSLYLTYL